MASDETMMSSTIDSSFQDEEEEFEDDNIGDHHTNPHNLSRLSVCTTSSTMCGVEDDVDNLASMCMSHLSIESFEGGDNGGGGGVEADGEFSDGKEEEDNIHYLLQTGGLSSDENYDELLGSCYSLPARRKNETQPLPSIGVKEYASENEAKKETKSKRRRRRRRVRRDTWVGEKENIWGVNSNEDKKKEKGDISGSNGTAAAAAGLMVITRPKGGNRSLCMDLEEVKACRDLGFELEHERMLEIINPSSSSRLSFSNSTSSGGNSPIANWRISAPGDDPRDVKARLKMWAQAVALASASSKYSS